MSGTLNISSFGLCGEYMLSYAPFTRHSLHKASFAESGQGGDFSSEVQQVMRRKETSKSHNRSVR
jgi:hypothetical protein